MLGEIEIDTFLRGKKKDFQGISVPLLKSKTQEVGNIAIQCYIP